MRYDLSSLSSLDLPLKIQFPPQFWYKKSVISQHCYCLSFKSACPGTGNQSMFGSVLSWVGSGAGTSKDMAGEIANLEREIEALEALNRHAKSYIHYRPRAELFSWIRLHHSLLCTLAVLSRYLSSALLQVGFLRAPRADEGKRARARVQVVARLFQQPRGYCGRLVLHLQARQGRTCF